MGSQKGMACMGSENKEGQPGGIGLVGASPLGAGGSVSFGLLGRFDGIAAVAAGAVEEQVEQH
ncbi:MAG: hypothetical protein ACKOWC_05605, partial [Limnohabitans sp.]